MSRIFITPERLQLAEPLMAKYFDYDSTMLFDEKFYCVTRNNINCIYPNENSKYDTVDYERAFYEHKELIQPVTTPYKKEIHRHFSKYFPLQGENEERIITDGVVALCLEYMSYIYYKSSENHFNDSLIIEIIQKQNHSPQLSRSRFR